MQVTKLAMRFRDIENQLLYFSSIYVTCYHTLNFTLSLTLPIHWIQHSHWLIVNTHTTSSFLPTNCWGCVFIPSVLFGREPSFCEMCTAWLYLPVYTDHTLAILPRCLHWARDLCEKCPTLENQGCTTRILQSWRPSVGQLLTWQPPSYPANMYLLTTALCNVAHIWSHVNQATIMCAAWLCLIHIKTRIN